MTADQIASILWRRRLLFAVTAAACLAAVAAVTFSLPKTYKATATLYVGVNQEVSEALAVDTNLGEQLARTYASLVANPNVADLVRERLPNRLSRSALLERMSFAPVERTQLLEVTAEGSSPDEARTLASTYASVFVDRVSSQFEEGRTQTRISVNEPAARPTEPSKPNPPLYLGLGGLLSLLLALGAVLLRERVDDRIHVLEDDDEVLGERVLARLPNLPNDGEEVSLEANDAFRLLKTNVDFFDDNPAQAIMVTSPGSGEGKTMLSANLAITAVADGEKVVLVEADLRRPGLTGTLLGRGLTPSSVGLTNYLVGAASDMAIINPHPRLPNLDVIWAGPAPPNPSALLRSHRFDTLLAELREDYDRIIVDTPPISVGADASVLVPRLDGVLYMIDVRRTKRSFAQAGLNQLEKARGRLYGVVLNRASKSPRYGYSYGADTAAGAEPAGTFRRRNSA